MARPWSAGGGRLPASLEPSRVGETHQHGIERPRGKLEGGHQGVAVVPPRRHGNEVLEDELGSGGEAERAAHGISLHMLTWPSSAAFQPRDPPYGLTSTLRAIPKRLPNS
jgi:hypothetical protein